MDELDKQLAWQALQRHQKHISKLKLRDLFAKDSQRYQNFSLESAGLLLDYSKNHLTHETLPLLVQLAKTVDIEGKIAALMNGSLVNQTEQRAALHTALREDDASQLPNHKNFKFIRHEQEKMAHIVDRLHAGDWLGATGKAIQDVVNIGIGGSHLGPKFTTEALGNFRQGGLKLHFLSNIDGDGFIELLSVLNPETTLFIISSKSFSTIETMTNANSAKEWLGFQTDWQRHFIAITEMTDKARAFGLDDAQTLALWDFVGGRYSIWSAIGLPLALSIGMENFKLFLKGAKKMDVHFRTAPLLQNMPVILGLLRVWSINFFNAASHCVIPYSHRLQAFPDYLRQLSMESTGKSTRLDGKVADYATGAVTWGDVGCDGQHSFFQLLHQGTHLVPVDFILPLKSPNRLQSHQDLLVTNCFSQSRALMLGCDGQADDPIAAHRVLPGDKPSNTLIMDELTPETLGALIALYEHATYVQACVWEINAFDQFGVEFGKSIGRELYTSLNTPQDQWQHDASTNALLARYCQLRED